MKYNTAENVITDNEGVVLFTVHNHRAALNVMQFKDGVAYMPVPRCETCGHWIKNLGGECSKLRSGPLSHIYTAPDFGCVQWKEK